MNVDDFTDFYIVSHAAVGLSTTPLFALEAVSKENNPITDKSSEFLPPDQPKQCITYASLDSQYMTPQTTNRHLLSPPPLSDRVLRPVPYPPQGMLGKEGLHICPQPRAERERERERDGGENIPSPARQKERRKKREEIRGGGKKEGKVKRGE